MRAGQEGAADNQVHALARRHHRRLRWGIAVAIHVTHRVHPDTRGIDHAACAQLDVLAAFGVARAHAAHLAALAQQAGYCDVVQHHRAAHDGGAREQHRQPRIVELPVPVLDAADQALPAHRGQQFLGPTRRQDLRRPQALATGEHVVHLQSGTIEGQVQDAVGRHDEGQPLCHLRRIGQQRGALVQRLVHQADVALRQVAHAAVDQLRGARGGALGEVLSFQQQHRESARRCIQRHAQPGGAAADDGQVPFARLAQPRQQPAALEGVGLQIQLFLVPGHHLAHIKPAPSSAAR